jgi:hypothetical protein
VSAASEKYFDHVQPPSDISTLSFGCSPFSAFSCWKLPWNGQLDALPSTDVVASHGTP